MICRGVLYKEQKENRNGFTKLSLNKGCVGKFGSEFRDRLLLLHNLVVAWNNPFLYHSVTGFKKL